jgi:hypothetical protein
MVAAVDKEINENNYETYGLVIATKKTFGERSGFWGRVQKTSFYL